jgi:hypothetical protein
VTSAARPSDDPALTPAITGTAQSEPEFGTPASIAGMIWVEPVAEPPSRTAPAKPAVPNANGAANTDVRGQRPVLVGFTQPAAPAAGPPARWPALSRVRSGLETVPRTGG